MKKSTNHAPKIKITKSEDSLWKSKKQKRPNLYDYLKVLALFTMIIDHLGYYLLPEVLRLRLIGRVAFPIFLFLVGFSGSYRWRRDIFTYGIILWVLGASIAYFLGFGTFWANILIVIVLARAVISILEQKKKVWFFILVFLLLAIFHSWLAKWLDYWALGFFFVLRGWIAKKHSKWFRRGTLLLLWLFIQNIQIFDFWWSQGKLWWIEGLTVAYVWILGLFCKLKQENSSLISKISWWNCGILWLSKQALLLYGVHIVILALLGMWRFGYL